MFKEPRKLLAALAFILIGISFFGRNKTFYLHFIEDGLIMPVNIACLILAAALIVLWLLYLGTKKILAHPFLKWLHIIITIILIVFIVTAQFLPNAIEQKVDDDSLMANREFNFRQSVRWSYFMLLSAQFLFLLNLILGLIGRAAKKKKEEVGHF